MTAFTKGKAMDMIMSEDCPLSADAKFVAVHLINRSKPDTDRPGWNIAWPAASTMAKALALKSRAVEKAISELRRLGATLPVRIEVVRRYRTGSGGRDSNLYRFTIPATAADMTAEHARNGRGNGAGAYPQKTGGHTRKKGGGIPAAGAEESSKEPPKEPPKKEMPIAPDGARPFELVPSAASKSPRKTTRRDPSPAVRRVFDAWCEILAPIKYKGPVELTDDRRRAIEKGLESKTPDELIVAMRGVAKSEWHCGTNDSGEKYVEPATIFKTPAKIDGHIERASSSQPAIAETHRNGPGRRDVQRDPVDQAKSEVVQTYIANARAGVATKGGLF